jgi:hypothetical protein
VKRCVTFHSPTPALLKLYHKLGELSCLPLLSYLCHTSGRRQTATFTPIHNSMDSLYRIERPRTKRRLKTKSENTVKERNRQRKKRKEGLFHKGYEMGEFCDYWVAVILYDPVRGEYDMFKSTDSPTWPPSFEQIVGCSITPHV